MAEHSCLRCGRCCIEVGRTFWKSGIYYGDKPFGNNRELNRKAKDGDYEDGGLPCEMLDIVNGLAVCKIERDFERKYKPIICIEYPADGELCFAEAAVIKPHDVSRATQDAGWKLWT